MFGTTFPLEFCRAGEVNKPLLILRYVGGGSVRAGRGLGIGRMGWCEKMEGVLGKGVGSPSPRML